MTNRQEQLEAIEQELKRQDEAWLKAKEGLSGAGDVIVAIPAELLEAFEAPLEVPVVPVVGVRG